MTASTGVPDTTAVGAVEPFGPNAPGTAKPRVAGVSDGGADIETHHRLRQALRILTAARRRDEGGTADVDG